jgi:hypothetical protein
MISAEEMARRLPKRTCESCLDIDVREWRRAGLLRDGLHFSCSWSRMGKPLGKIDVALRGDAVLLRFRARGTAHEQRIRLAWTRCPFGWRPWFRCACGCRRAKLFLGSGDTAFGCRLCHCLGYRSRLESPAQRAVSRAVAARMRLGGSGNLLDPFPGRPRGMHRRTYDGLRAAALAAEERMVALELDWLRTRYGVTLGPPCA